ncbi:MAG: DEAD/DEAH box helicase [Marmoricola sp.]
MPLPDPGDLVDRLCGRPGRGESAAHVRVLAGRAGTTGAWPAWADADLVGSLRRQGISAPWRHQVEAAGLARSGRHVVGETGPPSGKSLGYLLPALTGIAEARGDRGRRGATALYLSPTKALAHDQADAVRRLQLPGLRVATHDGDTSREERAWNRDHGEYLLSNPDMLHRSLLPRHEEWARFFAALQFVVVDEMHHYRGVFGAHVSHVLRRLRRVCLAHGSEPTFVLASATVADPAAAATRLTGLEVAAVAEDHSARGRRTVILWEPPFTDAVAENGSPVRRSATAETADVLTDLVLDGVRTLAFVPSRRGTETVAAASRRHLEEIEPGLGGRVAAYRGGYLPEERRALEGDLRSGRLVGLAATQALELGIDVSGLDAVLLAGFPGTRAAMWQQWGRAGRGADDALAVLVARDDPLDTYLVHHPDALLGAPVEAFVFDPANPYVLGPHLCAAAAEVPLTPDGPLGPDLFGPGAREAVDALTTAGVLRRRPRGWYWTDRRRACDLADIRSIGGAAVRLVEQGTGTVVGTVDAARAAATVHPGAVYLHQGGTWLVTELDLDGGVASLVPDEPDYLTSARTVTDIAIEHTDRSRGLPGGRLFTGSVCVSQQVVSYLQRRAGDGTVIAEVPLDLPEQRLSTQAVWWTLEDHVLAESGVDPLDLPGAAHAAEHASIGLLPLYATCDRWDIGGVSTRRHPDTGVLTVFVHDGHPGGAGFAARGYETATGWLAATRDAIEACGCAEGCPSCVQSPKCGNQNHPLDKPGAVRLLGLLLGDR